jgi:glycosyltransferase involved in cell wall biosynthesis
LLGFRNQSELPSIYALCDAFILPSEAEPWGLVVNEAMSCGLAVAVTDAVGAGPDLVRGAGEIYPCGDVMALASILARWATDPAELRASRASARQRVSTWSLEATAAGVLAGVAKALNRRL